MYVKFVEGVLGLCIICPFWDMVHKLDVVVLVLKVVASPMQTMGDDGEVMVKLSFTCIVLDTEKGPHLRNRHS